MSPREPWYTRVNAWGLDRIHAARRRWIVVDHLFRAGGRYRRTQGDLTAAGVTYYAFLGLFPVLLLAASVIGLVLSGNVLLQEQLFETIREAFPGAVGEELVRQLENAINDAGFIGLIALIGFVYAGLRTIDNLRLGMERIWKGHVDDPDVFRDNLADLVALLTLGGLGLASLGITAGVTQATSWVLDVLGIADEPINGLLTKVVGIGLAVVADVVVFLWLLRVVPSVSVPLLRLLPGALFGAAGFEVLKLLGGVYLTLISRSVTASAFGGAVGLLVWINVVARFSFFTAAWTATLRSVEAATPVRWSLTPVTTPADESPVADRSGSSRR